MPLTPDQIIDAVSGYSDPGKGAIAAVAMMEASGDYFGPYSAKTLDKMQRYLTEQCSYARILRASIFAQNAEDYSPASFANDLVFWLDGKASANRIESGGVVTALKSWPTGPVGYQPTFTGIGTARPTAQTDRISFDGIDDLLYGEGGTVTNSATSSYTSTFPDGANSVAGKGIVCTGGFQHPDATFYVSNHGWANTGAGATSDPSVVWLDLVGQNWVKKAEYLLRNILGIATAGSSAQGLCLDPSTDSLWVLNTAVSPIRIVNFNRDGTLRKVIPWTGAAINSAAFDPNRNELMVGERDFKKFYWINTLTGVVTLTLDMGAGAAFDQFSIDPIKGVLTGCSGNNGTDGFLNYHEMYSGFFLGRTQLLGSKAIEAPIFNAAMTGAWVTNDIYYHNGNGDGSGTNCSIFYDNLVLPSPRSLSKRFLIGAVFRKTANNPSGQGGNLFSVGDAVNNNVDGNKRGLTAFIPAGANDTVDLFVGKRNASTSSTAQAVVDVDVTSLVIFDVDTVALTATPHVNGVAQAPIAIPNAPTDGNIWSDRWSFGSLFPVATSSRPAKFDAFNLFTTRNVADLLKIEGLAAWSAGYPTIPGLLPVGHPYEFRRP